VGFIPQDPGVHTKVIFNRILKSKFWAEYGPVYTTWVLRYTALPPVLGPEFADVAKALEKVTFIWYL
jgi:hypothetical protein